MTLRGNIFHLLFALLLASCGSPARQSAGDMRIEATTEYGERRARLTASLGEGVGVVGAGKIVEGEIDENTPLYDFFYLTGWHREKSFLFLFPDAREATLFAAGATEEERAQVVRTSGIRDVRPLEEMESFVRARLPTAGKVYVQRYLRGEVSWRWLEELLPGAALDDSIGEKIAPLRMVKSEAELGLLRKASEATCRGLVEAMKRSRPGMNEGQLARIIQEEFFRNGCEKLAFPSIVGSGKNGTVIHYMKNKDDMPDGALVVCDVGGTYRGYAADVTRTLPVNGRFTEEQRELYGIVLDAQKRCEAMAKPGVSLMDLHVAARDALAEKGYAKYFPHLVGHYVGLAVHDSGSARSPLSPGMVITIEPGIYLEERRIGIRIEDTYIITPEGCERISSSAPREIDEIERTMSAGRENQ